MKRDREFILFGIAEEEYSYHGLIDLFILFFGSLLVAAVLSGPIFIVVNSIDLEVCRYIAKSGIGKIYDRIRLVSAIACLPLFICKYGFWAKKEFKVNATDKYSILKWALIGIAFMALLSLINVVCFNYKVTINSATLLRVTKSLFKFALSAITVGILEEIMFRGIVLRIFYTYFNPIIAILLSSIFFAYLHIKIPSRVQIVNVEIGIFSGFRCLLPMVFGFLYKFNPIQFLKLTSFGIILSILTLKNRSLKQAIGFHIGVVFAMFISNIFI